MAEPTYHDPTGRFMVKDRVYWLTPTGQRRIGTVARFEGGHVVIETPLHNFRKIPAYLVKGR